MMTIQTIGSWQITKEAFQIVWNSKGILGCFLILPYLALLGYQFILPDLPLSFLLLWPLVEYPYEYGGSLLQRCSILILMLTTTALWSIAWIQYILNPTQRPTLKMYFTFDSYYFFYLAYIIPLIWVGICLIMVLGLVTILTFDYMSQLSFAIGLFVELMIILPFINMLPAIAHRKRFFFWRSIKQMFPSYIRQLVSIMMGVIAIPLILFTIWPINAGIFSSVSMEEQSILHILMDRCFIVPFCIYFPQIMLITIISLYYKKRILKA